MSGPREPDRAGGPPDAGPAALLEEPVADHTDAEPAEGPDGAAPDVEAEAGRDPAFEDLLRYLHETRGFDFTGYKRPSLVRRVRRRMTDVNLERFADYLDYLEVHPDEFTPLFNTILINVTGFFRDRSSWDYLRERLLPGVLDAAGPQIRVWSAGCASGEEAYSLAILLAGVLGPEEFRQRVKVYATDVDEESLVQARQAVYTERQMTGLHEAEVEEFFQRDGSRYAFRKDLRRAVIFGRNDLVQDAPISHVDVLVCRNTLMYFNAETQKRILGRLHYALDPGGVLFLGKAEMLLSHAELFAPLELTRRFFRKRDGAPVREGRSAATAVGDAVPDERDGRVRLREQALLSGPAAQLVLDAEGRLAMVNHRAEHTFGVGTRDIGRPFQDLEVSYRPVELRASIAEAAETRQPVWMRGVERRLPGREPTVFDVSVLPLLRTDGGVLGVTVIFDDVTQYRGLQRELEMANRQLETAYEELQSTNEELETTNEELQSTVEELETTNEELQSTNEELETMNEELQSMNDELHATNEELRTSTEEVGSLNRFMSGVLSSFKAGVVVVDPELRVLAWNAAAEELWGLREDEVLHQHLLNLDIGLPVSELHPLLRRQLTGDGPAHETLELDAVNRRGRAIRVRVTVSSFARGPDEGGGAVILMDPDDR